MGQHAAAAVSSVRSPVSGRSVCSVGSSGSPPASVPLRSPGSSQRPPAARFRPVRCSASSRPFQVERILILKTPASASSHPCLLVFFLCFLKCIFSVPHGALVLRVAPLNISAPPGATAAPSFTPSLSRETSFPLTVLVTFTRWARSHLCRHGADHSLERQRMSLIVSLISPLPKFVSPLKHLGDCHLCSLLLKIKILEPPLTSFFLSQPPP